MMKDFVFTSESVTEGHPDKLCDIVADAIVDRFLQDDPFSYIVADCAVAKGILFVAARVASKARVDIPNVAREVIQRIGYCQEDFNAETCSVMTSITELPKQPGADRDEMELTDEDLDCVPARNQVTVFGYACTQTPALMPLPIWLAHRLARRLTAARVQGKMTYLCPDGTIQVGVEFHGRKPVRIQSITVIAAQTARDWPSSKALRADLIEHVITPAFAQEPIKPSSSTLIFVNPEGPFIGGGPAAHSGLTGRKNAIDTYGEFSRHSGSALSGKGPSRVDRTGAYAARHAAKNIVAAGLAEECEVHLSYTIGQARPVSVQVDTMSTGKADDAEIAAVLKARFDFRPAGIVRRFNLRRLPALSSGGFYRKLAAYGQMGRSDLGLPWETVDAMQVLKSACNKNERQGIGKR
jgi:S-adenosylmethionine synthetase